MLERKIIMNKTLRHVLFEFLLPSMKKVGTIETTWCKSSWENVAICCRLNKPISRPFKRYNREAKERKSSNPYGYYVYTICVYVKLIKCKFEILIFRRITDEFSLTIKKYNKIYLHFTSNSHLSSKTPIFSSGFVALQ